MTTNTDPRLIAAQKSAQGPAQNPDESHPTTDSDTKGVNDVALFESRAARRKRAWDELSEIDRAVILESARQRRRAQQQQREVYSQLYGLRSNR